MEKQIFSQTVESRIRSEGNKCIYCGKYSPNLQIDSFIPIEVLDWTQSNIQENKDVIDEDGLILCCENCKSLKSTRLLMDGIDYLECDEDKKSKLKELCKTHKDQILEYKSLAEILFLRQKCNCAYCGTSIFSLVINKEYYIHKRDNNLPRVPQNAILVCKRCNDVLKELHTGYTKKIEDPYTVTGSTRAGIYYVERR